MVPLASEACCGTTETRRRRSERSQSRTSRPRTATEPSSGSKRRLTSCTSVDLPEPVPPMMPRVLPGASESETCESAGDSPPKLKVTSSRASAQGAGAWDAAEARSGMAEVARERRRLFSAALAASAASRTSQTRWALAAPRVKTTTRFAR